MYRKKYYKLKRAIAILLVIVMTIQVVPINFYGPVVVNAQVGNYEYFNDATIVDANDIGLVNDPINELEIIEEGSESDLENGEVKEDTESDLENGEVVKEESESDLENSEIKEDTESDLENSEVVKKELEIDSATTESEEDLQLSNKNKFDEIYEKELKSENIDKAEELIAQGYYEDFSNNTETRRVFRKK